MDNMSFNENEPNIVTQTASQLLQFKQFDNTNQLTVAGVAGSTTPLLGTTCPAASATVVWIKVLGPNGNTGYIPMWQ
jgi:hypothetical protein